VRSCSCKTALERIRHSLVAERPGMGKVVTSAAGIAVAVVGAAVAADLAAVFAGIAVGVAGDGGAAVVAIVVNPKPLPLEVHLLVLTSAAGRSQIQENYLASVVRQKQRGLGTEASSDILTHPTA